MTVNYDWIDGTISPWDYDTWDNLSIITDGGHNVLKTLAVEGESEGRAVIPVTDSMGRWVYRFRSTSTETQFIQFLPILTESSGFEGYNIRWNSGGTLVLNKGSTENDEYAILGTADLTYDTDYHILIFERDSNGDMRVSVDDIPLISANDMSYSTNSRTMLRFWSGLSINYCLWDYLTFSKLSDTSSLLCVSNIKSNTLISTLECVSNISEYAGASISTLECVSNIRSNIVISEGLNCKSNIKYPGWIRTGFEGEVLVDSLSHGIFDFAYLDTENHRWVMLSGIRNSDQYGTLSINGFDLLSYGFDLEFELSGDNFKTMNIVFNRSASTHYWALVVTNYSLELSDQIDDCYAHWNVNPPEYPYRTLAAELQALQATLNGNETYIKLSRVAPSGLSTVETIIGESYNDSIQGKYRLIVTENGIGDVYFNDEHIIQNKSFGENVSVSNGKNLTIDIDQRFISLAKAYIDNLLFNIPGQTSTLELSTNIRSNTQQNSVKCISNIRSNTQQSTLECIGSIGKAYTLDLVLQGSIFTDNPMLPAPEQDKLIFMEVNDVVFPDMIQWQVDTRGNDQNTTFTITYRGQQDLLLFTGQIIKLIELHGDPDGFFEGVIQKLTESNKTGERVYTIIGRAKGNPLVTQGFHINAESENPSSFTSEQWLNMILFGTGIKKGPCVDIHVENIVNANDLYNGFAGNWETKAKALTELLGLISKLKERTTTWFLDAKGLLRIYYPDIQTEDVGITIFHKNPRVLLFDIDEDAQNIINSQRGTGGKDNEYKTEINNVNSRNGWYDSDNELTWPGYGFMPGQPVQDSAITNQNDLNRKVQGMLEIYTFPTFTVTFTLSKLPGCEIGQPVYIPDHYKLKGKTLVITSLSLTGDTSKRVTNIVATNDKTVLGPLNDYESIKTVAKHAIAETAPFYGDVVETGDGSVTVKPVNNIANVNAKDLSKDG